MYSVWKYTLQAVEHQEIHIPYEAKILSVQAQHNEIVLYALVRTGEPLKERLEVAVYGTGHDIPSAIAEKYTFLGTVPLANGNLMFHVFYF